MALGKGIPLINGFDLNSKQPLDNRAVADTTADMNALITGNSVADGQLCYCKEDKKLYVLKDSTWTEVGGGDNLITIEATYNDDDSMTVKDPELFEKAVSEGKVINLITTITIGGQSYQVNRTIDFSIWNIEAGDQSVTDILSPAYGTDNFVYNKETHVISSKSIFDSDVAFPKLNIEDDNTYDNKIIIQNDSINKIYQIEWYYKISDTSYKEVGYLWFDKDGNFYINDNKYSPGMAIVEATMSDKTTIIGDGTIDSIPDTLPFVIKVSSYSEGSGGSYDEKAYYYFLVLYKDIYGTYYGFYSGGALQFSLVLNKDKSLTIKQNNVANIYTLLIDKPTESNPTITIDGIEGAGYTFISLGNILGGITMIQNESMYSYRSMVQYNDDGSKFYYSLGFNDGTNKTTLRYVKISDPIITFLDD